MLSGEHAVLRDYPALVAAVDKRIFIELSPLGKNHIIIESDKFGSLVLPLEHLSLSLNNLASPFHFVGNILARFADKFINSTPTSGMKINITSEFSPTVGLGSSAALTVALLYGLTLWFENKSENQIDKKELALIARELIRQSQNGLGSGADVMASVFGNVIYYQLQPLIIESLIFLPPLVVIYSGSKTATPIVVASINEQEKNNPKKYKRIFDSMGSCSSQARLAILRQDWALLGKIFSQHALLQHELGVATPLLNNIQDLLQQQATIFGAKISGSGLGDCIIGIGSLPQNCSTFTELATDHGVAILPVILNQQGVRCES